MMRSLLKRLPTYLLLSTTLIPSEILLVFPSMKLVIYQVVPKAEIVEECHRDASLP